jgi:hypothetical protein
MSEYKMLINESLASIRNFKTLFNASELKL